MAAMAIGNKAMKKVVVIESDIAFTILSRMISGIFSRSPDWKICCGSLIVNGDCPVVPCLHPFKSGGDFFSKDIILNDSKNRNP